MVAAVYARKSTDQSAVADEAKSVTRQIDHAKAYAARGGWPVPESRIFVDDGISGAEFANRPGFVRLMAALKPRPPFQVLIMSEESRLEREAIETAYALKQLIQAGCGGLVLPRGPSAHVRLPHRQAADVRHVLRRRTRAPEGGAPGLRRDV
jgi:DNA invertase Pin-like site-specific DNA recombinase